RLDLLFRSCLVGDQIRLLLFPEPRFRPRSGFLGIGRHPALSRWPRKRRQEPLLMRSVAVAMARYTAAPQVGKVRRYTEFYDGAASWSRVERIIGRVEAGAEGTDTRFIVTSLPTRSARVLYKDVYCRRGAAENHIKAWKTHLAADRTSCPKATANQFRLFLHAGAYWLLWSLRSLMPKASPWRVAQFDTLRLRLIKIAARVAELK